MEANGFPQFKQIDYLPTATGFRQGPGKKNAYIYIYIHKNLYNSLYIYRNPTRSHYTY